VVRYTNSLVKRRASIRPLRLKGAQMSWFYGCREEAGEANPRAQTQSRQ
jgi:hypothetical protein